MARKLSVLLAGTVAAAAALATATSAQAAGTLYVQQASSGTLQGSKLVLHGVSARTTTFADRPVRRGGSMPTSGFVSTFARTFAQSAPNAAIEIVGAPAARDVVLVELRAPRYDAKRHTLTYTVKRLRATKTPGLAGFAGRADGGVARHFGRTSLFIDDGSAATEQNLILAVTVPAGATLSLSLDNGTFDYNTFGTELTNLSTPILYSQNGQVAQVADGEAELQASQMAFAAAPSGNGLTIDVVVGLAPSSGTGPVTGTATIPAGGTATATVIGGAPVAIANGAFSIPIP